MTWKSVRKQGYLHWKSVFYLRFMPVFWCRGYGPKDSWTHHKILQMKRIEYQCALAGGCDVIITNDRKGFEEHSMLPIMTAAEFLQSLMEE